MELRKGLEVIIVEQGAESPAATAVMSEIAAQAVDAYFASADSVQFYSESERGAGRGSEAWFHEWHARYQRLKSEVSGGG